MHLIPTSEETAMSTTTSRQTVTPSTTTQRVGSALLALGGVAFIAGGATHPSDSGQGNKIEQLHEALVDSMWYPSHAMLLLAMSGFAAGILALRLRPDLTEPVRRVVRVVSVVAVVAVLGMTVHLLEGLNAENLADGEGNFFFTVQVVNETVISATWGLAILVLAVVGGLTRTIGNRVTLVMGLVGGACFALAAATIAYTDRFDALFPVASLIGLWGLVVGLMGLARKA